jgi:hypothetical protein
MSAQPTVDPHASLLFGADLADSEIDAICAGYRQNAAKVRFLRALGVHVERKPNGRPLVNRQHYNAVRCGSARPAIRAAEAGPKWRTAV